MKRINYSFVCLLIVAANCSAQKADKNEPRKVIPARLAETVLTRLKLPTPVLEGATSLEEVFVNRRSVRQFTNDELDLAQIGQLAWAGQGITDTTRGFRTAPSAGAIYPIKLYFAIRGGMYLYHPDEHILEKVLTISF